jgi:hypothetical protein
MCRPNFLTKMFILLCMVRSISDKTKTMGDERSFVLVLNMNFKILSPFLFGNREIIFETHHKWMWMLDQQIYTDSYKCVREDAKKCRSCWFRKANSFFYKMWHWTKLPLLPIWSCRQFVQNLFLLKTVFSKKVDLSKIERFRKNEN